MSLQQVLTVVLVRNDGGSNQVVADSIIAQISGKRNE